MKRLAIIVLISAVLLSGCVGGDDGVSSGIDWELTVDGDVNDILVLTFDDLLAIEPTTIVATLEKTTGTEETNTWTGVSIDIIADMAGIDEGVEKVIVSAIDGYAVTLDLQDLEDGMIAYEMDGERLPEGEALRLVLPNMWGPAWIRGVANIRFTTTVDKLQVYGEVKAPLLLSTTDLDAYIPTMVTFEDIEYAGTDISALLGDARYVYSSTTVVIHHEGGETAASVRDIIENKKSIVFVVNGSFSVLLETNGVLVAISGVYAIEVIQ